MILEAFTTNELYSMHHDAGQFAARMYASSLKLTQHMSELHPGDEQYTATGQVRDVAFAAGRESEELMLEIGRELARRRGEAARLGGAWKQTAGE